ncbi:MAG: site-specific DNA-methyltransferase [Ignavibacteriales bacterium CG12_big_fil_rev_8_21_14_0_65_30_8]|nr:MAG: site-specific DNA-methyltransferase [Ignavibacteriales bacterium CG12_big_fil_rev_8_21_14_0_65_30_8]
MNKSPEKFAPNNRTLFLSIKEKKDLSKKLIKIKNKAAEQEIKNKIINQNLFNTIDFLPDKFIDLLFVDPPYNLNKKFNSNSFKEIDLNDYEVWFDSWFNKLIQKLKQNASVYICGDWNSSPALFNIAQKYLIIRNRITWEREKGRGAKSNWKNCSEDIWYCTKSNNYTFNVDDVKIKRKVLAPYKDKNGLPKDWVNSGDNTFRITFPSNLWTDITIPFWSMPENTDHPTQKPEKLLAKIILASTNKGDFVFDPFLGSGTTAVVSKKLGRNFSGIEIDKDFCCIAQKRIELAEKNKSIQGYYNNVFWERNTLSEINRKVK